MGISPSPKRYKEFKQILESGKKISLKHRQELESAIAAYEGVSQEIKDVSQEIKDGICFAGTLLRNKLEIEEHISKIGLFRQIFPDESTKWLVLGKNPSNKKIEQADTLGIPMVSEEDFFTSEEVR